jgi:hypothetical protein
MERYFDFWRETANLGRTHVDIEMTDLEKKLKQRISGPSDKKRQLLRNRKNKK